MYSNQSNSMQDMAVSAVFFGLLFSIVCACVVFFFPSETVSTSVSLNDEILTVSPEKTASVPEEPFSLENFEQQVRENSTKADPGLELYRQPQTRGAVEWFYTHLTEDRDVAIAILNAAEEYNIPLSLAFALAHTESNYNPKAHHTNTNGSIDRGLFQLNNESFTSLTENQFYDPEVSSHYGMAHLRFCLNSAGNEIAALAMYNAGSAKVKKNNTPQTTLNYISKIQNYKSVVEDAFNAEVLILCPAEDNFHEEKAASYLAKK